MMKKTLFVSVLLALSMIVVVNTALAGSVTLTGTIGSGDPTMPVIDCPGQGISEVAYHLIPFTVDVSGIYDFSVTSPGGFAALYLLNLDVPLPACSDDEFPTAFSVSLMAGTQYVAAPFDGTFAQFGGDYTLMINGPGNILLGGGAGGNGPICIYQLPVSTPLYHVPAGAPAFFEPRLDAGVHFNLPAGTWKITEFSGDFAKVWIACQAQPIWIPRDAVGAAVG